MNETLKTVKLLTAMDINVKLKRQLAEMGNTLNSYTSDIEFPKLNIKQPINETEHGNRESSQTI